MNDMSGHMAFKPPIPNRTFALVLLPGFSLLSLAGVTDTLKCANAVLGSEHYRWSLHAIDGPCVGSLSGLDVNVPGTPDSMEAGSNVILIGGRNTQNRESVTLRSWLRRTAVKSPLLGGIFTGSRLLAEAGLLDGYTAAIHWEMAAGFREAYPGIDVTGTLFEIDRNRLTCAGEHAVADMMLNIIANLSGKPVASTVAARLLHIRMRSPAEPQAKISLRTGSRNKYLIRAIALMEENPDEVLDIESIAATCGCSRRHMERIFRENVGCAPIMYYRNLRLERARNLLLETDMSCIEVAVACGFQSSTTFSNAYYRRFGRRPAKEFQGSGGMDKSPTPAPLSLPFRETVIRDGDLCEKAAA